jgi:biotin-(acetyl-CoA carboxylase) ligase
MLIVTDSRAFAEQYVENTHWYAAAPPDLEQSLTRLLSRLFCRRPIFFCDADTLPGWHTFLLAETAKSSQFDILCEVSRDIDLPDGLLCCAGSGDGFHGFKGRPWKACAGNIHLSIHFKPNREFAYGGVPFIVLGAVSVLEAVESLDGLETRPEVSWVNDVVLNRRKIAGVIARVQTQGGLVSNATLGIGLNVETTPEVKRSPFVPAVAALNDFLPMGQGYSAGYVCGELIQRVRHNYERLLRGDYASLAAAYRQKSSVIGRRVRICEDRSDEKLVTIGKGKVIDIDPSLALHIEGHNRPIVNGRLILLD